MMSQETDKLRDLVKVLNTGSEFYSQAKERITDRDLQGFFDTNTAVRRRVLDKLQEVIVEQTGTPERDTDLESRLEEYRAELRAVLDSNDSYVYVDQLEDLDKRAHEAFEEALDAAESSSIRSALEAVRPAFEEMHDRARAAKNAAAGGRETPTTIPTRIMR